MIEPATQSRPDANPHTQGHNIFLIVAAMFFLPPVGVYLLEGQCGTHTSINIACWFFFITPSYVHGFGLLAYWKLYPKVKSYIDEVTQKLQRDAETAGGVQSEMAGTLASNIKDAIGTGGAGSR